MFIERAKVDDVKCLANDGERMNLKVSLVVGGIAVATGTSLFGLNKQFVEVEVEAYQTKMPDPETGEIQSGF